MCVCVGNLSLNGASGDFGMHSAGPRSAPSGWLPSPKSMTMPRLFGEVKIESFSWERYRCWLPDAL